MKNLGKPIKPHTVILLLTPLTGTGAGFAVLWKEEHQGNAIYNPENVCTSEIMGGGGITYTDSKSR